MENAVKQRDVSPRLDWKEKVAGPSDWGDSRINNDNLGAVLARLPDVVSRNRSTFSDIRSANPYDLRLQNVVPRVGSPVDAKSLPVSGACAHHAESPIVIRVRCLEANTCELPHQISFLGREARSAQTCKCGWSVRLLDAIDLLGNLSDSLLIGYRAEPVLTSRVPFVGMQQTIRMCTLQVTFHALWAKFSSVEREFIPRLVADHLIVLHEQLDPALLPAKAAVGFYYLIRHNTGIQSHAGRLRKMRAELFCDRFRLGDKRGHNLRSND